MEATFINNTVSSIQNINFFQFRWTNQRDSAARLERVLGEFLGQMNLESEIIYDDFAILSNEEDRRTALKLTHIEGDDDSYNENHLIQILGSGVVGILADYTYVYFLSNGVCIVDQRDQAENWHNGEGGFFATQPGTAFARVMAHGFIPEPVEDYPLYQYVHWCGDPKYATIRNQMEVEPLDEFQTIFKVELVDNGIIRTYDSATDDAPTVYATNS